MGKADTAWVQVVIDAAFREYGLPAARSHGLDSWSSLARRCLESGILYVFHVSGTCEDGKSIGVAHAAECGASELHVKQVA